MSNLKGDGYLIVTEYDELLSAVYQKPMRLIDLLHEQGVPDATLRGWQKQRKEAQILLAQVQTNLLTGLVRYQSPEHVLCLMKAYDLGDHIDVLSERLEIEKHKEGCPTTILNEVLAFLRSDIGRHIIELATFKSALQMLHPSPDAASEADKGPARLGPFADVHDAAQEDMDRYAYGKGRHSSGRSKSWYYDYSTDDVDDEEEEPYPGF